MTVPRLNSNFMSSVIAEIESIVNSKGYNPTMSISSEEVEKEIASANTMFHNQVVGLSVLLAYNTKELNHYIIFHKNNIPVIFNYPVYKMSEVAASNLINHLKGSATIQATSTTILRTEIILRPSSQKSNYKL